MENKDLLSSAQNREVTQRREQTPKSLTPPTAIVDGVGTPFFLQPVNSSPNRKVMTTLRITLRLAALLLLLAPLAALRAVDVGPIVGAIRRDSWYGVGTVTKAVEASLGQPRMLFSAVVVRSANQHFETTSDCGILHGDDVGSRSEPRLFLG